MFLNYTSDYDQCLKQVPANARRFKHWIIEQVLIANRVQKATRKNFCDKKMCQEGFCLLLHKKKQGFKLKYRKLVRFESQSIAWTIYEKWTNGKVKFSDISVVDICAFINECRFAINEQ